MATRTHVSGEMDNDSSDAALDALMAELDTAEAEHPDGRWRMSRIGASACSEPV